MFFPYFLEHIWYIFESIIDMTILLKYEFNTLLRTAKPVKVAWSEIIKILSLKSPTLFWKIQIQILIPLTGEKWSEALFNLFFYLLSVNVLEVKPVFSIVIVIKCFKKSLYFFIIWDLSVTGANINSLCDCRKRMKFKVT